MHRGKADALTVAAHDYDSALAALSPLLRRLRRDVTAVKGKGGMAWTQQPLSREALQKHLNGGPARGCCPILEGQSVTMVGTLDLDDHDGTVGWQGMLDVLARLRDAEALWGLVGEAFRSSGGKGIHVFFLWEKPQDAASVRALLRDLLTSAGLREGTGGVASGQVEVFPKQDSVPMGGKGNQFILPLAGASEWLGGDISALRWGWCSDVPIVPRVERVAGGSSGGAPLVRVRGALMALGNADLDYDEWRDIIFAVHEGTGGSDEGLALAIEWSALSEKHDEAKTRRDWGYAKPREGGVTVRTLFAKARERAGWQPDYADAFEPLEPQARTAQGTAAQRPVLDAYAALEDMTDTGNANMLRKLTKGDLRYVAERSHWLHWDGKRWFADLNSTHAHGEALRVGRHYLARAEKVDDAKLAEALTGWGKRCRNKSGLDNMLGLAQRDVHMAIDAGALDQEPMLLGVPNGVVDLRTGELRAAARDDLVTKMTSVEYDPDAKCPRFEQVVREVTGIGAKTWQERPEVAEYLRMLFGYLLTGSTAEQKMFIFVGDGSNGKNLICDVVQHVMGDYGVTIPPEALMATRTDVDAERPNPIVASLAGARLAMSSESKDGQKLDVALMKRHTGDKYMTARLMRENPFRFLVTHKLLLMTNHRPSLDHMDDAMKGRLHLVPFNRRWNRPGHVDSDPALPDGNKDLPGILSQEMPGILSWLVRAAKSYLKVGLTPPREVIEFTHDYFQENDTLREWIQQCEQVPARVGTGAVTLREAYKSWCIANGVRMQVKSAKSFANLMSANGIDKHETKSGMKYGLLPISLFQL